MIETQGSWSFDAAPVYFLAANTSRLFDAAQVHDWLLLAVNEVNGTTEVEMLEGWLDQGKRVLLDSGVFWLANTHARTHGVSMDQALGLDPEQVDGFDWLWTRYVDLCRRYGDQLWGYIELDQGGVANKRRTRSKLHDLGLRPMPVYHPINDGWDYFDELAEGSDRICCGNVVQAPVNVRLRLLATFNERRRAYPHLWIHALGYTPNQWAYSIPTQSADSSTWMSIVRWPTGLNVRAMGASAGKLSREYQYQVGDCDESYESGDFRKCARMSAVNARAERLNWAAHLRSMEELGIAT